MYGLNITILPFVFSGVSPSCIRFICKHFYTGEIGNFAFQILKMYILRKVYVLSLLETILTSLYFQVFISQIVSIKFCSRFNFIIWFIIIEILLIIKAKAARGHTTKNKWHIGNVEYIHFQYLESKVTNFASIKMLAN
jgi:hypothetical protein